MHELLAAKDFQGLNARIFVPVTMKLRRLCQLGTGVQTHGHERGDVQKNNPYHPSPKWKGSLVFLVFLILFPIAGFLERALAGVCSSTIFHVNVTKGLENLNGILPFIVIYHIRLLGGRFGRNLEK